MSVIIKAIGYDQGKCYDVPKMLKSVNCSDGNWLCCASPAGHFHGAAEPVPLLWEQKSSSVPSFSARFVFSPSLCSHQASPACSCSTVSRGSAPAAMSSASTSVMVLTNMTLLFQGPGAWHKQVRCDGALAPSDKGEVKK